MAEPKPILPRAVYIRPLVRQVLTAASKKHGVPLHNLVGANRRRTRKAVQARHEAIRALYGQPLGAGLVYGLSEIGRCLGLDHSTVFHAIHKEERAP